MNVPGWCVLKGYIVALKGGEGGGRKGEEGGRRGRGGGGGSM